MILDMARFDSLVKHILTGVNTDKLNQQILSDWCGTVLKTNDYNIQWEKTCYGSWTDHLNNCILCLLYVFEFKLIIANRMIL